MKNQKRSKSLSSSIIHLPDDVVLEILKWLPVTDVLKYCRVCKRWRDLISTQHFKEMHVKSCSPPMVLVSIVGVQGRTKLLLLQNIWDTTRKRLTILKFDASSAFQSCLISTYEGLIVFYNDYACCGDFIFNPISGDKFSISRPTGSGFTFFGMFFNKWIKEYCVLWGSFYKAGNVQIKMLIMGVQQSFRDLKPPNLLMKKPKCPPVFIGDATLYWLLLPRDLNGRYVSCDEVIMKFDTRKEEFTLIPHPIMAKYCSKSEHANLHIVKIGDYLSFVRLRCGESFRVDIWTLKDSGARLWLKTHKVSFDYWDGITFDHIHYYLSDIEVMAIENGELLLNLWPGARGVRLYACNLNNGTVRKIGRAYDNSEKFCMYIPSFASPQNGQITQI